MSKSMLFALLVALNVTAWGQQPPADPLDAKLAEVRKQVDEKLDSGLLQARGYNRAAQRAAQSAQTSAWRAAASERRVATAAGKAVTVIQNNERSALLAVQTERNNAVVEVKRVAKAERESITSHVSKQKQTVIDPAVNRATQAATDSEGWSEAAKAHAASSRLYALMGVGGTIGVIILVAAIIAFFVFKLAQGEDDGRQTTASASGGGGGRALIVFGMLSALATGVIMLFQQYGQAMMIPVFAVVVTIVVAGLLIRRFLNRKRDEDAGFDFAGVRGRNVPPPAG